MSATEQTDTERREKPRGLRAAYDWMMRNASGRHARVLLAGLTFAEASIFPIPTDIMLIPMVVADRKRAWFLAFWCTLWSVLGGAAGYAIGAFLFDSLGQWLIRVYHLGGDMAAFEAWYSHYGAAVILIKGFTPIPYKLVTITSGFAGFDLWWFIVLSIITRGGRFFFLAVILNRYGDWIRTEIERNFTMWVTAGIAVLVGGFIVAAWLF